MPYPEDQYKLKDKSNVELYKWLAGYKPGSAEYVAGIQESMRRVARIEELMEKQSSPILKRELISIGIAVLALIVAIIAIVHSY